jgi:homoserine kinase
MRRIDGDGERFELIIEGQEGSHLRGGPDNLVYRAAQRVWKAAGQEPVAIEARVRLAVPPARGLGSSATAIVAGLVGANALVGEPLSREKLLELAIDIEGHPDNVVPSLLGGLCMTAKAASQRWRVVRCEWMHSIKAVVAIPAIRLSTSEARRAMPKSVPIGDAVVNLGALTLLLQGLRTGNGDLISDGMHDRLTRALSLEADQRWAGSQRSCTSRWSLGMRHQRCRAKHFGALRRRARASRESCHGEGWEAAGVASRAPLLNLQTAGSHWQPKDC